MATELTISKKPPGGPALDQRQLYALGLKYAQDLARQIWTDYNVHDPGVTTLELLCYALTDLSYRASLPIEDVLATETGNAANMKAQFFTARRILPNRPLTLLDYRKLLIDLKGVKNAWLKPADIHYFADTLKAKLLHKNPGTPGIREVQLRGLYKVLIDYMDDVTTEPAKTAVMDSVRQKLHENRNLCEDFTGFDAVQTQSFILCAEIELEHDADVSATKAQILFEVQDYLAPAVNNYTLSEMLERKKPNGKRYTVDEIFDGPALDCGFIDDYELTRADLRDEIRLSDIISIIMDIKGVRAVRDIVINPAPGNTPLENKWLVPVDPGKKPLLNKATSRLVFYKRSMPAVPSNTKVDEHYQQLAEAAREKLETENQYDLDVPIGQFRNPRSYYSFQNHFPGIYGLSDNRLSSTVSEKRRVLAYQLKAYLLFFDQVMANYLAQLAQVKELFSTNGTQHQTYFYQVVNSFADFQKIYAIDEADVPDTIKDEVEDQDVQIERRNRFLDHLIARFAEQFSEYVSIMYSTFGTTPEGVIDVKCKFLQDYPAISSERSLGYNYSLHEDLWDTNNVSGLERRLARLLGIHDATRRDLSSISLDNFEEGMYLIENILLRPEKEDDPFLPICVDPTCADCPDDDPYSYRLHIILPADAGRFKNMDFRRFIEEVIRQETPAHILPKICWISQEDMSKLEKTYRDWIGLKADVLMLERTEKLTAFRDTLYAVKNVYPKQKLFECDAAEDQSKFILGQSGLGTSET